MTVDWREIPFAQLLTEPLRNGIYKRKEFHGCGIKIVNMGELGETVGHVTAITIIEVIDYH